MIGKKNTLLAVLAALVMLTLLGACCAAETAGDVPLARTDVFEAQARIDEALKAEMAAEYDFSEPEVILDPYQTSPLTAVVLFHTDEAVGGTIAVKGKDARDTVYGTIEPATDHLVPVYGLYNGGVTEVELTLDDGQSTTLEVETEAQKLEVGEISAEMIDESAYDYGCLTFIYPFGNTIYAVDSVGDVRWVLNGVGTMGVHRLKNGHLMVPMQFAVKPNYYKEGLQEIDLNGRVYARYIIPGGEHHDFQELPNGNLLVSSDAPDLSSVEDWVVEIDRATGEVVWQVDMKDLLSTTDGQSASMNTDGSEEYDWCHNNSVWYDAENDLVLLSCRHLDAIVAVNRADRTLAWILGDPTGWTEADPGLFFTPEGDDFEWQYAQHQVTMLDNGDIMLFDNGTAKVKRINDDARVRGDDIYSRAVVYRIDTDAMTIRQVFEYGKERGPEWYSDWVSGVESQDGTADQLWITAGSHLYDPQEDRHDFYPSDMMKPGLVKSTHMDLVKEGELAYELTISGDTYQSLAFRSSRLPMYVPGAYPDPDAAPICVGRLGETPATATSEPVADVLPLTEEGWSFTLDDAILSVKGTLHTDKAADALGECSLILQSEQEARHYALTQFATEGENGVSVALEGWVSTTLPEGSYRVLVALDGTVYATGYSIEA